jgi:fermentation-respiration switch protein FrsA (DUF1100 family)
MNDAVFQVLRSDVTMQSARETVRPIMARFLKAWPGQTLEYMDIEEHTASMADAVVSRAFRSFLTCDATDYLRRLRCPILAIYGQRDLQVPPGFHRARLERTLTDAGHTDFVSDEFVGLNHLFQSAPTGALSEYKSTDETIAPVVLKRITAWIRSRSDTRAAQQGLAADGLSPAAEA